MKEIAKNREEAIRKIYLMISVVGKVKNIDKILKKVANEYNVLPEDLVKISGNFTHPIGSLDQRDKQQDIKFLREGLRLSIRSKSSVQEKINNIITKIYGHV